LIDPDFTNNQQKLPLPSISNSTWVVANPTISISYSDSIKLDFDSLSGTAVSIGYNGLGIPYLNYYNFISWLVETVLDNDPNWSCG
jgi:hypothetical protein